MASLSWRAGAPSLPVELLGLEQHLVLDELVIDHVDGAVEVRVVDAQDDGDLLRALRDHADVDARLAHDGADRSDDAGFFI